VAKTSALKTEAKGGSGALEQFLTRVQDLHPRVIDLSLDRIERLLAALGHPEQALPPVLHIAGTNGKGSTLAILRALLERSGQRVHLYTSPHLVRFNERIVVAGDKIEDGALMALLEECEAANAGAPITFFEFTTAAAYLAFAREPADILLLETGLGGRLDATNVIERPALSAISPVSLDHQGFLGDRLDGIAHEKAGILKPGVTGVIAAQPPAAMTVIEAQAKRIGAPLYVRGDGWQIEEHGERLAFSGRNGALNLPKPPLAGRHQIDNAGLALACLDCLPQFPTRRRLAEDAAASGMGDVIWPGRLQRLREGPLFAALPIGAELWLDGGHNPSAGEALADWAASDDSPLYLIAAVLDSKDAAGFLKPIAPHVKALRAIAPEGEHAFISAEKLTETGRSLGIAGGPSMSTRTAIGDLFGNNPEGGRCRVLICGSLYLAGDILREHS